LKTFHAAQVSWAFGRVLALPGFCGWVICGASGNVAEQGRRCE